MAFLLLHVQNCWWKLNGDEIATIASRIAIAGCQSTTAVTTLGRWLNTNVASVNDAQLKLLLAAHGDFGVTRDHGHGHGNSSYIWPLERYVSARVGSMDRTAVAMCVDFFRRQRWLSTRVLDAVARKYDKISVEISSCVPKRRWQGAEWHLFKSHRCQVHLCWSKTR